MGYYARVPVDVEAPAEPAVAPPSDAPVSGFVWRNGRATPFTLETVPVVPTLRDGLPEQLVIAALLLVSFVAPIFHWFG